MAYLTKEEILITRGLSSRKAAERLGVGKTSVNKYRLLYSDLATVELPQAKVLTLDIESRPGQYYAWGPKNDWIASGMMIDPGGMMCFAAKWLGQDEIMFFRGPDAVKEAHRLLSEADLVVTYNGDRYDLKRLNNEFLKAGMAPPKPYRSIDLIKTNRKQFDLPYKKLDYLAQVTELGGKVKHSGFDLWIDCMADDPEAWKLMEEYNKHDVVLTEGLYVKLLPWLSNVPHMGMFVAEGRCPYCGSENIEHTEEYVTALVQKYELLHCANCQGWSRGNKPVLNPIETRRV
jgi:hypothetical protein